MKKIIAVIIASSMMMSMNAQVSAAPIEGRVDREDRMERLSEKLNLSPEQKEKLEKIRLETRESIKNNNSQNAEFKKNVRAKAENDIRNVLDDEQKAKFDQVVEKRKARSQEMRANGEGKRGCASQAGGKSCCKKGQMGATKSCSGSEQKQMK